MRAVLQTGHSRRVPVSLWPTRPRQRSFSAAVVASVVLLFLFLYARPSAVMAGTPRPLHENGVKSSAQIVSHSLRFSREHGYLVLSGEARNVSRRELPQLEAVVELFDESGRLVDVESGLVKMGSIATGDEAPFEVQAKDDSSVTSYRIRFRKLAGAPVPSRIES